MRPAPRLLIALLLALALPLVLSSGLVAQPGDAPPPTGTQPPVEDPPAASSEKPTIEPPVKTTPTGPGPLTSQDAIRNLIQAINAGEAKLGELNGQLATVRKQARLATGAARTALDQEIADLQARINRTETELSADRIKLESIAAGVDAKEISDAPTENFDINKEISLLLEPLVQQLKEITEEPREIERLSNRESFFRDRITVAQRALDNLQSLLARTPKDEAEVREHIEKLLAVWNDREAEYKRAMLVASIELQNRRSRRRSLLEATGEFLSGFFRSRGYNLLLAGGAFLVVFLALRFMARRALKVVFRRGASFYSRLAGVILEVFIALASIMAMVLALFSVSDWLLLVLVLVFLFGIGWASINTLPQFFEQVRLLLNLGSVRESERVIFEGLPWRVDALRLYTRLRNPALSGGEYRIPVRDLIGLHSRPLANHEVWFPSRENDWVVLQDGTFGRVILQSPDTVQIVEPGGARFTYSTTAYLEQNPKNLSTGFRVSVTFGIDYDHQAQSTSEIPELMRQRLATDLLSLVEEEHIHKVAVEFKEAGASSLDYQVLFDVAGEAAPKYQMIKRAIPRILVDACNEHGWVIPFTQITLHQAGGGQPGSLAAAS